MYYVKLAFNSDNWLTYKEFPFGHKVKKLKVSHTVYFTPEQKDRGRSPLSEFTEPLKNYG